MALFNSSNDNLVILLILVSAYGVHATGGSGVNQIGKAPSLLSLQAGEGGETMIMVRTKCSEETWLGKGRAGE